MPSNQDLISYIHAKQRETRILSKLLLINFSIKINKYIHHKLLSVNCYF